MSIASRSGWRSDYPRSEVRLLRWCSSEDGLFQFPVLSVIDAFIVIFGLALVAGGVRAIRNKRACHDYGEAKGSKAVSIGYLWIVLGLIAVLGILFDVKIFRQLIELLITSGG